MSTATVETQNSRSDWTVVLGIGAIIVLLGLAAWAYQAFSQHTDADSRPAPVWLSVDKIETKMSDGSMLAVKFNLQLAHPKDQKALSPYTPAFKSMVEVMATDLSYQELAGPDSMAELRDSIQTTLNDYLEERGVPQRVKDVMFEEWLLLL